MERNYDLAERLSRLGDDTLIGVEEVSALTGFSSVTIQQRRARGLPDPIPGLNRLRWRLGTIRAIGHGQTLIEKVRRSAASKK